MITPAGSGGVLFRDNGVEMIRRRVDGRRVGERASHDNCTWPFRHGGNELSQKRLAGFRRRCGFQDMGAVIDQYIGYDFGGERIIGLTGRPLHDGRKFFNVAVARRKPDLVSSHVGGVVGLHRDFRSLEFSAVYISDQDSALCKAVARQTGRCEAKQ